MALLKPCRAPWRRVAFSTLLAAALLALGHAATPPPAAAASREFQLKAVFVFNFAQFVEWPAEALPASGSPLVIGVLGDNPFGSALDDALRGESVGGRPLRTQVFRRIEDVDSCHILFISPSEASRLGRILARLKGRSILTVGDTTDFARQGGMIRFVTEQNKIRLRINLEAARAAGLVISSKLLRHAEIVGAEGTP